MRGKRWWIAGALVLLTVVSYAGVRDCGFLAYDDDKFVTANPHVARGLSWGGLRWALSADLVYDSPRADYWEPLVVLSRMADVQLFGMRAGAHHLTNLALHAASVVLLFWVLHGLTGAFWRSAIVAAIFGVHPLHVESVAWISERKDVLSGLLFMLTLAAYAAYVRSPSPGRRLLVAVAFAGGLMAKPMLVTVPFVLLLLDLWPAGRLSRGAALVAEKAELFVLSAVSIVISLRTMAPLSPGGRSLSLPGRIVNAVDACGSYLSQAFWPAGLAVGYPHVGHAPSWPRLLLQLAALAAVSVVVIRQRARRPYLLVGWCWFLGMLVPVIGLVQVGVQGRADRYMYLPLVGLSIGVVWWVAEAAAAGVRRRRVAAVVAATALAALAVLSWRQVGCWKDDFQLFSHAVRVLPGSPIAHNSLAVALTRLGRPDEAAAELREALRLGPGLVVVRRNLAFLEVRRGRVDEGVQVLEQGLAIVSGDGGAASELHLNLGFLRAQQGRTHDAEVQYAQAVRADPRQWGALYNWGNLLAGQGRLREAEDKLQAARRLNPDDAAIPNNLGLVLLLEGRAREAVETLSDGLRWFPDDARLHMSLGRALHASGRDTEALARLREAVSRAARSAEAHYQLGQVLEATGATEEALVHYREALRLDPGDAQARAALRGR
jgi:Flp pilus assembly protein TadD